jgi:hypothetical protein
LVNQALAPRGSFQGFRQALRRTLVHPGDLLFAVQLGYFIWRAPHWLATMSLPNLLGKLSSAPRPAAPSTAASLERIIRLSQIWFKLTPLRAHNTCYLRALTIYRFLYTQEGVAQIHFAVEPARTAEDHIRGHAWVTVDELIIEPPPQTVAARARAIYSYPPEKGK